MLRFFRKRVIVDIASGLIWPVRIVGASSKNEADKQQDKKPKHVIMAFHDCLGNNLATIGHHRVTINEIGGIATHKGNQMGNLVYLAKAPQGNLTQHVIA